MPLYLEQLRDATIQLRQALEVCQDPAFMSAQSEVVRNLIRAGVIQYFEYTYERSCILMQRWLREEINADSVVVSSRRQMFRLAARTKLIDNFEAWLDFHQCRNLATHVYSQDVAQRTYSLAPSLLAEASALLAKLEELND